MLSANSSKETLTGRDDVENTSTSEKASANELDSEQSYNGPTFNPALYIQRYLLVADTVVDLCDQGIKDGREKFKILDLGCANCSLFVYLKNALADKPVGVSYMAVDKDRGTLEFDAKPAVEPGIWDYTKQRSGPISIRVYYGDILQPDDRLKDADVLIMVEVIEHLPIDVVESTLAGVILGQLRPRAALLTTPNFEFNVLFPDYKEGVRKFRHWDHKFEWTREEFETWCTDAAQRFGYSVTFQGIGTPPPERTDVGCCSQMAYFTRQDPPSDLKPAVDRGEGEDLSQHFGEHYETIEAIDFKWQKPPTPMERLSQNITTALRYHARAATHDIASDCEEADYFEEGAEGLEFQRPCFPVTALSSFVEHMEEEEGLELIREIAVTAGFRLSDDLQYVLCSDSEDEDDYNYRTIKSDDDEEEEKHDSTNDPEDVKPVTIDYSVWNWND